MVLSVKEIEHARPGNYIDGNGLYLQVSKAGSKSWIFRFQLNGKRREMGLGSLATVPPVKARAIGPRSCAAAPLPCRSFRNWRQICSVANWACPPSP